jgi:hypothetical protein
VLILLVHKVQPTFFHFSPPQAASMAGITAYSKYLLMLLCCWGVTATLVFSSKNGLFPALSELPKTGLLPGTKEPIRYNYTGLKGLDQHLGSLVCFFWVMITGDSPDVSLHSIDFVGQGTAAWVICVVEGFRTGNKRRVVS